MVRKGSPEEGTSELHREERFALHQAGGVGKIWVGRRGYSKERKEHLLRHEDLKQHGVFGTCK